MLHPVSLTFSSVSSGSTLPLRYCALQNCEFFIHVDTVCLFCNSCGASTFSFEWNEEVCDFDRGHLATASEFHLFLSHLFFCVQPVFAREHLAASCEFTCFTFHLFLCEHPVFASEHLAAACKLHLSLFHRILFPCLTFSFVSSLSHLFLCVQPVSPFPLCPACLCLGTSCCSL